jgi:serine/threonine protein kinase
MYASVQLATHKATRELRAVKRISKVLAGNSNMLEQSAFNSKGPIDNPEVELLLQLEHPNIVSVKEVYESEAFYFIVTEYCSGGQLFKKIV